MAKRKKISFVGRSPGLRKQAGKLTKIDKLIENYEQKMSILSSELMEAQRIGDVRLAEKIDFVMVVYISIMRDLKELR